MSKNWCFLSGVLEKTLESPLDSKEIQPVHPKGNQSWIFIGRTNAEAEALIPWPPDVKSWFIGKDSDGGKDWRQEEKGTTDDEMVGWDYRLDGHEFEQALGVGDGQGSLVCCSPWGLQIVGHNWVIEQQQQQMVTFEMYSEGRANGFADGLAMEWGKERTRGWIFGFLAWVTWRMVALAHWDGRLRQCLADRGQWVWVVFLTC